MHRGDWPSCFIVSCLSFEPDAPGVYVSTVYGLYVAIDNGYLDINSFSGLFDPMVATERLKGILRYVGAENFGVDIDGLSPKTSRYEPCATPVLFLPFSLHSCFVEL